MNKSINPNFWLFLRLLLVSLISTGATQASSTQAEAVLREHSNEFRREVIKVTDSVYVAVGYGASNSALVIGETGPLIVDTGQSITAAEAINREFRKISDKPVTAIIYTHSHRDHISGASIFAGDQTPDIFASANFANELVGGHVAGEILFKRTKRQFGLGLKPETEVINVGVGKEMWSDGLGGGFLPVTVHISDERYSTTIEGVRIDIVAAPGETDDQRYIWLPDQEVLFAGDNFYKAFPNLYPIRGSRYRDVNLWANSLEKMTAENPVHLVPSHTRPISGRAEVNKALSDYAAGIRSIHDQTIAGMNRGYTPDQLAEMVTLPERLAASPYLQEFYGKVPWAVRSVFSGYLGWFDGNPSSLLPLTEFEEASRIAKLAGGAKNLFRRLKQSIKDKDYQWAMRLADYLITLSYRKEDAIELKITALTSAARLQTNAPARNYYLSVAQELQANKDRKSAVESSKE